MMKYSKMHRTTINGQYFRSVLYGSFPDSCSAGQTSKLSRPVGYLEKNPCGDICLTNNDNKQMLSAHQIISPFMCQPAGLRSQIRAPSLRRHGPAAMHPYKCSAHREDETGPSWCSSRRS